MTDLDIQQLLIQLHKGQEEAKLSQEQAKLAQEKQAYAIKMIQEESNQFNVQLVSRYQEQRKEDTQTLLRVELNLVDIKAQNADIIAKVDVLEAKLEKIEANTVQIRDILLSEFQAIDPQLKAEMVVAAEFALSQPEVVEQIDNIKSGTPIVVVKNGKRRAKHYPAVSALQAFAAFFGVVVKEDYRKEQGKFSARVMRQLTGIDFGGKYPAAFDQFLAHVGFYYQTSYVQPLSVKEIEQKVVSS
jgi:hypothetical protein